MIWLSVICVLIFIASSVLAVKIYLIKKDIASIDAEFYEILNGDTNGLITIDGRDKSVRRLAANLNLRLKELRSLRLKYEHGDLELKNAVANVSHDLRTPLTAIIGYLEHYRKPYRNSETARGGAFPLLGRNFARLRFAQRTVMRERSSRRMYRRALFVVG